MKTLPIVIITIIGIVVIASTSIGIFIEKIGENPQQPYAEITINGLKENYTSNEPLTFSVKVYGYGSGCGDTKAIITKENDSQFKSPVWGVGQQCNSSVRLHNFEFNALPVNTSINEAGNYILKTSFDDFITSRHAQMEQTFSVIKVIVTIADFNVVQQTSNMSNTKNHDPFGITALIINRPSSGCLGPPGNGTGGGCPPNNFYLKINSNSTAYLVGYNICDNNSCAKNNNLSLLLPINTVLNPNYQSIGLPVNLQWKYGDTVNIQLEVSSNADNKTASPIDLGNSTIVS